MTTRHFEELSPGDQLLRNRLLMSENKKLQSLVAKLEIANISLKNENSALKKHIEARANEKFSEMVGQILGRAERASQRSKPGDDADHS